MQKAKQLHRPSTVAATYHVAVMHRAPFFASKKPYRSGTSHSVRISQRFSGEMASRFTRVEAKLPKLILSKPRKKRLWAVQLLQVTGERRPT